MAESIETWSRLVLLVSGRFGRCVSRIGSLWGDIDGPTSLKVIQAGPGSGR